MNTKKNILQEQINNLNKCKICGNIIKYKYLGNGIITKNVYVTINAIIVVTIKKIQLYRK